MASTSRKKRYYQVKLFLADKLDGFDIEKEPTEINVIDSLIKKLLDSEERKQEDYQQQINYIHQITQQEKEILAKWLTIASELGYKQGEEPNLLQIDELADTQIRFPLFLLTTHYWEGRWLIDVLNIDDLNKEKGKNGLKTVERHWQRKMMLTPCVVMTCYMLPNYMLLPANKGQKSMKEAMHIILLIYSLSMRPVKYYLKLLRPPSHLLKSTCYWRYCTNTSNMEYHSSH